MLITSMVKLNCFCSETVSTYNISEPSGDLFYRRPLRVEQSEHSCH